MVNVLAFLSLPAQAPDGTYTRGGRPYQAWFEVCVTSVPTFCQDVNTDPIEVDPAFGSATAAVVIDAAFMEDLGTGVFEARLQLCPGRGGVDPASCSRGDADDVGATLFEVVGDGDGENGITLDAPDRVASELAQFGVAGVVSAPVGHPVADVLVVLAWERETPQQEANPGSAFPAACTVRAAAMHRLCSCRVPASVLILDRAHQVSALP